MARVAGIDINADVSWAIVFALLGVNLTEQFRSWHPSWGLGSCVALAFVGALLFFASVVAHELAHALVAISYGIRVRQIRLFLFGGVSDIEREPDAPKKELLMAIVGPLTSVAIGVGCAFAGGLFLTGVDLAHPVDTLGRLGPVPTLFFWLAPVNIALGLFNLLPGFPLDGGRVLRALLWMVTGDLRRSTAIASWSGRLFGYGLSLAGIAMMFGAKVPVLGEGLASGLWLAMIGGFLAAAARRSYGALLLHEALNGVRAEREDLHGGEAMPRGVTRAA